MQITHYLHTAIVVSELDQAERFYGEVLGWATSSTLRTIFCKATVAQERRRSKTIGSQSKKY